MQDTAKWLLGGSLLLGQSLCVSQPGPASLPRRPRHHPVAQPRLGRPRWSRGHWLLVAQAHQEGPPSQQHLDLSPWLATLNLRQRTQSEQGVSLATSLATSRGPGTYRLELVRLSQVLVTRRLRTREHDTGHGQGATQRDVYQSSIRSIDAPGTHTLLLPT